MCSCEPCCRVHLVSPTYRIEKVSNPLSHEKTENDRNAKCYVARTLENNDSEADGHAHCASQLTRCTDQCILGDLRSLQEVIAKMFQSEENRSVYCL